MVSYFVKNLRYRGVIGFFTALLIHKLYIFFKYRIRTDEHYIKKSFYKIFGHDLNLESPETLNENLQCYKLNFKDPLMAICADKYAVREYIKEKIGEEHLIPLVFHTEDFRKIKPENLPGCLVIVKANHTAGTHQIIRDKNKVNWHHIQTDCRWWLHLNYYYMEKEWQYNKIKPRLIVEKLLIDEDGNVPSDYKLHYFGGKFEFLQVDIDRFSNHKRNLYNRHWDLLPFTWSILNENGNPVWDNGRQIEKPSNLEELIALGEKLAAPFPYVRVDFYILNDKIYFGELTFHHGGGFEHFTPGEWDLYYGKKINLKSF